MPARPDASTLGATAFNVGMITKLAASPPAFINAKLLATANSFATCQDTMLAMLADIVEEWLPAGSPNVVGLIEIDPTLVPMVVAKLKWWLCVEFASCGTNTLMWRAS